VLTPLKLPIIKQPTAGATVVGNSGMNLESPSMHGSGRLNRPDIFIPGSSMAIEWCDYKSGFDMFFWENFRSVRPFNYRNTGCPHISTKKFPKLEKKRKPFFFFLFFTGN
jgi:hypothetical protein